MSTAANWDALEEMWRSQKPGYKCGWWESHNFFLDKFDQEVQLWNDRKRGEDSTREFRLQVDGVALNKRIEAAIEMANRHTALIPACAGDTHQWWWPWIQAFFENLKIQIAARPVPAHLFAYTGVPYYPTEVRMTMSGHAVCDSEPEKLYHFEGWKLNILEDPHTWLSEDDLPEAYERRLKRFYETHNI